MALFIGHPHLHLHLHAGHPACVEQASTGSHGQQQVRTLSLLRSPVGVQYRVTCCLAFVHLDTLHA